MNFKFSNMLFFLIFTGLILVYFFSLPFTKHNRYTLYFLNLRTKEVGTEARYVLKTGSMSREVQLVQELVLFWVLLIPLTLCAGTDEPRFLRLR